MAHAFLPFSLSYDSLTIIFFATGFHRVDVLEKRTGLELACVLFRFLSVASYPVVRHIFLAVQFVPCENNLVTVC